MPFAAKSVTVFDRDMPYSPSRARNTIVLHDVVGHGSVWTAFHASDSRLTPTDTIVKTCKVDSLPDIEAALAGIMIEQRAYLSYGVSLQGLYIPKFYGLYVDRNDMTKYLMVIEDAGTVIPRELRSHRRTR